MLASRPTLPTQQSGYTLSQFGPEQLLLILCTRLRCFGVCHRTCSSRWDTAVLKLLFWVAMPRTNGSSNDQASTSDCTGCRKQCGTLQCIECIRDGSGSAVFCANGCFKAHWQQHRKSLFRQSSRYAAWWRALCVTTGWILLPDKLASSLSQCWVCLQSCASCQDRQYKNRPPCSEHEDRWRWAASIFRAGSAAY